jgi:catechol 2,3-dioxygenase-like lactoylglutathione lyase family enzyme
MPISNVILHVRDLQRSVSFYEGFLSGQLVDRTGERAILDFVTATIELRSLAGGSESAWQPDDTVLGFRHVGFKVASVDDVVAALDAGGVEFRSRPHDVEVGAVRNAFFFDPDGTVLELVERHLEYTVIHDRDEVEAERRMPTPARPRFDHVGHTVESLSATTALYGPLGFVNHGTLLFDDERGFRIDFLRGGETVLEVFTFSAPTSRTAPDTGRYGFAALDVGPVAGGSSQSALPDGRPVAFDPDGLPLLA